MTDGFLTTIFAAGAIVTMNPSNPTATHVAVRDGRILGVGALDELTPWGPYVIDTTFADKVLVPGFVEAHSHVMAGSIWAYTYVGYFARTAPDGTHHVGLGSIAAVVDRLREADAAMSGRGIGADEPLLAWGLDPIYFAGERLVASHLDEVSTERPILVAHASLHLATVNTAMLRAGNVTAETETEGVVKGVDGQPVGELQEPPAMMLVPGFGRFYRTITGPDGYGRFARLAVNAGITTVTDLGSGALESAGSARVAADAVSEPDFPVRLVQYCRIAFGSSSDYESLAARFLERKASDETDKLRYGGIKIIADGSIQGYTAVLNWPGYVTGAPNGLWLVPPSELPAMIGAFHRRGINVHVHCNGDAVVEAMIDAVDQALRDYAWLDHRHTVQHCQLATSAQFRRMARLGVCANIFANHLWFWGDQHYASTVGPERANRLEPCATAKREGVRFAIHSDAPVTPLGQLHTVWCAVNRTTPTGRVLGEHEKIGVYDALQAVTIDAAYQLHMDHEIGSIEVGKLADFAVLDGNPLTVDPMTIRDINVWGTVLGGVKYPAKL